MLGLGFQGVKAPSRPRQTLVKKLQSDDTGHDSRAAGQILEDKLVIHTDF